MGEIESEGFNGKTSYLLVQARPEQQNILRGKMLGNRVPKGGNQLKVGLLQAVNAIRNLKNTYLFDFFKRIACRRGKP